MSGFRVREAIAEDLPRVLGVQHRAFGRVALQHGIDPEKLPPLRETAADLARLLDAGMRFWVAEESTASEPAIVGSVRAETRSATVEIGRLVVDDGWTRRGVASALMDSLEAGYPHAERFELFTGAEAAAPLALYAKRGYRTYRAERMGEIEIVWLQKAGPAASDRRG